LKKAKVRSEKQKAKGKKQKSRGRHFPLVQIEVPFPVPLLHFAFSLLPFALLFIRAGTHTNASRHIRHTNHRTAALALAMVIHVAQSYGASLQ
jgi:hypothetical protein